MRLKDLPSEFQEALPVLEKIKAAGFEAYFVGGSVRDALLGQPIHDVDIASSSYPAETKKIFPRTVDIGIEHGTVLVLENGHEYEITTFRTEDVYVDYRRPSQVSFVRSLEEDLKRRDFTINAFALNERSQVIDKFNGLADLGQKRLRAVGNAAERFNEDALRIMRGLRFTASLDFDIEEETFTAMKEHAPLLEKISVERSFIEFDKLLLAPYWRKGIDYLIVSQAYDYLPFLQDSADKWQKLLKDLPEDFTFTSSEQAWASVLLYLDIKNIKSFLKSWKTSNDFQKTVEKLLAIYRLRQERQIEKADVYHYGASLLMLVEELRQAQGLVVDFERIKELDAALTIHDKHEIVVRGGDLIVAFALKPGPNLGKILNQIESFIVDGNLANERQAILDFVRREIKENE
ncbi:CCA tRNA nucleotidyltransferase [Streptococcus ratti]|uniref:CCA-adding enzyme n=1 Tax=Streptococcus ratti FA-1 = DSM 20564 TaxID=699248 RepID=A0ABP2R167_STRRT|nr:CCA tRNA nucleotidyltransferase [Streptococcus ratti]EJN93761.1 tRNA CCA-pyrophosphorylase [Streptococcus ratti FA-1 = DSM 20564]EMP66793.1 tRNA CCA-pyrophosphorylase [Streptococcus ratti FA-1 = DSM 20564]QEY07615.1 CCA tRNA nucleotidyltransferase [Streptococcus ratti]VEI60074.1 tRNA CCA-pyrophosphorylase [Streptococcus mutans]